MLTIAAFASLAQLGSGLALALAIFIEPIAMRERRFREKLDGSLRLLLRDGTDKAETKENEIWMNIVSLNTSCKSAHEKARIPMWIVKIGASINFIILILATVCPDAEISATWMWILLFSCIAPVVGGYISLIILSKTLIPEPQF